MFYTDYANLFVYSKENIQAVMHLLSTEFNPFEITISLTKVKVKLIAPFSYIKLKIFVEFSRLGVLDSFV